MATSAVVLKFEDRRLHAFQRHGSKLPWFVLAEVCEILEIEHHRTAAKRLDDDEKGVGNIHSPGGAQQTLIVSLSGLTQLAATSRKPIAKRFNKWLHSDVVVSIFLTGEFTGDSTPLDALIGELQPTLPLGEPAEVIPLKPHPSAWSASYNAWRNKLIDTISPRPLPGPLDFNAAYEDWYGHENALTRMGHTPVGYADPGDDHSMFMRDELPIGHHADSWRVWVSEQWFRLPLELRQRWWKDTNYGANAPSPEMIDAIIKKSMP